MRNSFEICENYLVSVIIPVYNCEAYLSRAVESVIAQPDFNELQLILVDDGSKDSSGKVCDSFSEKFDNIISIHQENSGVSVARNAGLEKATGKWISFLDSDDYLFDGIYKKMLATGNEELIFCDYTSNDEKKGNLSEFFEKSFYKSDEFNETLYKVMALGTLFYNCWNKLYKREIIVSNDIKFKPGVKLGEDMMFVYEYIKYIKSVSFVSEPLYFYYINPGNATSVVNKNFEVCMWQYDWVCNYFKNIECDYSYIKDCLNNNLIYRGYMSIVSAGTELSFSDAVKYIKSIFDTKDFYDLFMSVERKSYNCRMDEYIHKLIFKKNAVLLVMLLKFNAYRSK